MLQEIEKVRQIEGEGPRRWFVDEDLELILWYDAAHKLEGFQICYDKRAGQRTVTWKRVVQCNGNTKSILISDGPMNKNRVLAMVKRSSDTLETGLRQFILTRLEKHGG